MESVPPIEAVIFVVTLIFKRLEFRHENFFTTVKLL